MPIATIRGVHINYQVLGAQGIDKVYLVLVGRASGGGLDLVTAAKVGKQNEFK